MLSAPRPIMVEPCPGFLVATTPEIAVISNEEGNPFGHPHPDVLADLVGVEVRRTDQDGDVVVSLGR